MANARKGCLIKECPLFGKKIEVPYSGSPKSKIVLCGESPGWQEESRIPPKPFVGDAGKLAKKCCREAGLPWHSMLIMNAARCRIIKDNHTTKEITSILKCCRTYVEKVLKHVKPKAIIVVGDFALRQILRRSGITKARKSWEWSDEFSCWIRPTFHPAYLLRGNMALKPVVIKDLKSVREFVDADYKLPKAEADEIKWQEVDSLDFLAKKGGWISLDTETQGLDWVSPNHVCISVSASDDIRKGYNMTLAEECPIDQADKVIMWPRKVDKKIEDAKVGIKWAKDIRERLRSIKRLVDGDNEVKLVMMNGSFDIHVLNRICSDFEIGPPIFKNYVMDIQAAAHVIDENINKMASLESLQQLYTTIKEDYNKEFALKHDKADMLAVPPEERSKYACYDAATTLEVALTIRKELKRNKSLLRYFVKAGMPILNFLTDMEEQGAVIDQELIPEVTNEVYDLLIGAHAKALRAINKKVKIKHVKRGLRLSRDDLVRDTLFLEEGFGLEPVKKTKTGYSIDSETRQTLLDRKISGKASTFLEAYNEWSEYNTLYTRYLRGFAKAIREDGRIHTNYSLTSAATGRTSSSNPNLQNVPKRSQSAGKIRRLISAPKGYLLLATDASQAELRWLAHLSRDPEMLKIFRNDSLDIHTETAKGIVKKPWKDLTKEEKDRARREAKSLNFGTIYLISLKGFIRTAKKEYGVVVEPEVAKQWMDVFFNKYSWIRKYHEEMIDFCREHGYVESPLGRRRRLPEIYSNDKYLRGAAERQAVNHPIQHPSSDAVLLSGKEAKKELNPDECQAILFIHDELIFEVKDNSRLEENAKIIKRHMENPPLERDFGLKLQVPLVADVKIGPNLEEMKKLEI